MAADSALQPMTIPGFHTAPTIDNLRESSNTYNELPHAADQLEIPEQHLRNVLGMIRRYSLEGSFQVHLIHRHDQIGQGLVRVESDLKTRSGSWTKPHAIELLNLLEIHGNVFMLLPDKRFIAYEFCEGPPPASLANIDIRFLQELTEYLWENELTKLVGLEVHHGRQPMGMVEFEVNGGGTVLLPEPEATYGNLDRATGWTFGKTEGPTEPDGQPEPGTHWAVTTKKTHKVFVDGTVPKSEEQLVEGLLAEGILSC